MNSAAVSPPRNRMKRAPSPLTLSSPANEPLFPCIMWMSWTPRSGEKPSVVIDAVVDEGFPEGDDDRFGVRLGPFDQHSRSADGRRNSEADVRVFAITCDKGIHSQTANRAAVWNFRRMCFYARGRVRGAAAPCARPSSFRTRRGEWAGEGR